MAVATSYAHETGRLKSSRSAAKLFLLHRDRRIFTPEWRGWFITQNTVADPESTETSRVLLQDYSVTLQYVGDLIRQSGVEREMQRWRELLNAA